MKTKFLIFTTLFFWCFVFEIAASDVLWLSNTPPSSKGKFTTYGMHRLSCIKGKRGSVKLLCWIKSGISPESSHPVTTLIHEEITSLVFSPKGELIENQLFNIDSAYALAFAETDEGFYNAYLIRNYVQGDTLFVNTAKAELAMHSCRNGHDKALPKHIEPRIYSEQVPFEIVRERLANEDFHTFIASGDSVTFRVMFEGKPVNGAGLTLSTQKGWMNTKLTDMDGKASFQFINDYFSRWEELNKRNIYYYLLTANSTIRKEGIYNGLSYKYVHYTCTLSDGYFPSRTMYASLVWSLLVFTLAIVVPGIAIYIFRERRKKPFKEIVFDA